MDRADVTQSCCGAPTASRSVRSLGCEPGALLPPTREGGLREQDPGSLRVWVPEPAPCLEVRE